jgi:NADPH:quinone reductase-like Zn-dependent oxidoreductase
MKAAECLRYGPPEQMVEIREVGQPAPGDDEVLLKVHAASINVSDMVTMLGKPYATRLIAGLRRPKQTRLGHDVAGVIEAVGKNVSQFQVGDAVFGVCKGACAEYACTLTSRLARKPDGATFEQAASLPVAGLTALQSLRNVGKMKAGDRVLITGASSGVGSFAVQIAKALGGRVTAVCSTKSFDAVRSLGPDDVIDYMKEDYAKRPDRYDVIVDLTADRPLRVCRRLLTPTGRYVGAGVLAIQDFPGKVLARLLSLAVRSKLAKQPVAMFVAKVVQQDLTTLATLLEKNEVRPLIDRTYPLSKTGEAFAYLAARHAHGKVVIRVPSTAQDLT